MMLSVIGFLIFLIFVALLTVGLVQCKKNSFMPGFYFFLVMMIGQIYSWISPFFIRGFFERDTSTNGMSLGEWFILFSYIPRVIDVIALGFLVVGLYRMWNRRLVTTSVKDTV